MILKTTNWLLFLIGYCALTCVSIRAATLHVWQDSPSPVAPFTNWATAAHVIQDAVDAAQAGDSVLVTNGVYATGGRAVYGLMTNRVAVDKAVVLRSVNGPEFTVIQGRQVPGTTNGDGAIRCVYLTNGAVLNGFTLTNGATRTEISDMVQESGGGVWCESVTALVTNCTLTGNSAWWSGGGAYGSALNNCTLTGNSARFGGGVYAGALNNCTLTHNSGQWGGGAYGGTLNSCTLTGNSASSRGGGACGDSINNDKRYSCMLNNCVLTSNSAQFGGGVYAGTLNHCTLTGNSASIGGGASLANLTNCIVYYNAATNGPNFYPSAILSFCCTTPVPTNGISNITNEPAFVNLVAGDFRLRYGSPCIDAGTNLSGITDDLDGHPRPLDGNGDGIANFDIGAYERVPLARYVWLDSPNPAPPHANWDSAAHTIQDAVDAATTGDLVLVTNGVYATGGRAVFGTMTNRVAVDTPITLASINGPAVTVIQGHQVPDSTNGDGAIRCVYLTSGAVLSGFTLTNGATKQTGDHGSCQSGGGVWCESENSFVSNCVLTCNSAAKVGGGAYSGTIIDCSLIANSSIGDVGGGVFGAILNRSFLTDNWTPISGGGAAESTLRNCTLARNHATQEGGGAVLSSLENCALVANLAGNNSGGAAVCTLKNCSLVENAAFYDGGGAGYRSYLTNCTLVRNSACYGGGASYASLNHCTLWGNTASISGGGAFESALKNCIVSHNFAPDGADYAAPYQDFTADYCCLPILPQNGTGNITNEPAFVNPAAGDFHLQPNSPCINAGNNSFTASATDLDGNPRIISGTVDIGAYEYQGTGSVISYAWLQQYGLPTDGSADLTDLDLDGADNYQEWTADTVPTNAASFLNLTMNSSNPPVAVAFASSAARLYTLLSCTNLTPSAVWTPVPEQIDVPGNGEVLTLTDTNTLPTVFYRVSVRF